MEPKGSNEQHTLDSNRGPDALFYAFEESIYDGGYFDFCMNISKRLMRHLH